MSGNIEEVMENFFELQQLYLDQIEYYTEQKLIELAEATKEGAVGVIPAEGTV